MVVRLRLAMHGTRNHRIFHLVAINGQQRRNAKPIETLGIYNPTVTQDSPNKMVEWSVDRIKYWLSVGAQPSDSVVKLLTVGNVIPHHSPWHTKPSLRMRAQPQPSSSPSPQSTDVQ